MLKEAKGYILQNKDKFTRSEITTKLERSGYDNRVVKAAADSIYPRTGKKRIYYYLNVIGCSVILLIVFYFAASGFNIKKAATNCELKEQAVSIPQNIRDNYIKFEVPVYAIYNDKDYCGSEFKTYPVIWTAESIKEFGYTPEQFGKKDGSSEKLIDATARFKAVRAFELINIFQNPSVADRYDLLLLKDDLGNEILADYTTMSSSSDSNAKVTAGIYNSNEKRLGDVQLKTK